MRITLMCPKCGSVIGCDENDRDDDSDICRYCNVKRMIVDFDAEILHTTPNTEFHTIEQKINRKFLYQLPTFDEAAYEARTKREEKAHEDLEKTFKEIDNLPRCPICNSVNLSKISAASKVGKIAMFGIFGMGDNGKTWKCNNCGSKF